MARHYTTKQLIAMDGQELIKTMDKQSEIVDNINLLSDDQRTSTDDHNLRVAHINIDGISGEWARRFEG